MMTIKNTSEKRTFEEVMRDGLEVVEAKLSNLALNGAKAMRAMCDVEGDNFNMWDFVSFAALI